MFFGFGLVKGRAALGLADQFSSDLVGHRCSGGFSLSVTGFLLGFKFFLVRGFYLFLTYNPQLLVGGPSSTLGGLKAPVSFGGVRAFTRGVSSVPLALLWQQWFSFFYVAFYLAQVRTFFFWAGASSLVFFARALSWFSWGGSFLA